MRNLTAVTLFSNVGTFIIYGMTNLISMIAFMKHPSQNKISHVLVPILGFIANIGMLVAVFYLGILGGGDTKIAAMEAILATAVWTVVGILYLAKNSRALGRKIISSHSSAR
ncbi:Amino acid transporter (fragment) [Candidatus Desulfosporosinus infrequens]|uniref:Amino acid transporter n=1 Tax=Candidatus Desulfosporosinus infrequens TaxID=2043169 RepID=A0A2U3LB59_9FIRM